MNNRFSLLIAVRIFVTKVMVIVFILVSCKSDPARLLVKEMKSILGEISVYEYGKSRSWLQQYDSLMAEAHNMPEVHDGIQKLLLKTLKSDASSEAKLIICQSLGAFANSESIPVLIELLKDSDAAHMGLIALTSIPDAAVDDQLIDMLHISEVNVKIGIINALGQRRNSKAVDPLGELLNDPDQNVRVASIRALGQIGGRQAFNLLESRFEVEDSDAKWEIADEMLSILDELGDEKSLAFAANIYDSDASHSLRFNAFYFILNSKDSEEQVDYIITELTLTDADMQKAIVPCIRALDESADLQPFLDAFRSFPLSLQMQLMLAIADRKEQLIRPLAIAWLGTNDLQKRITALKSMINIADSRDIIQLARIAANKSGMEQELARQCLYWMDDPNADQTILDALGNSRGVLKAELINCVGYRKIIDGNTIVLKSLDDPNSSVRTEAIIAFGKIGAESDLDELLDWTLNQSNLNDTDNIKTTLTNLTLLSSDQELNISQLDEKLQLSPAEVPTCIFLEVLGEMGGQRSFSIIRPFIDNQNDQIQFTALKVLSNWENDMPLNTLKERLQSEMVERNHSQTLAGIVYLVQYSQTLSGAEKVNELQNAFAHASTDFDKKMIVRGFSRITNEEALNFCIRYIDDNTIKAEVQNAVIEIAGNLRYSEPVVAKEAVEELLQKELEPEFKERLKILQKSLSL